MSRCLVLFLLAALTGSAWADDLVSVADLVKQLGDARFARREAAHKELIRRGEGIVPELDSLAKGADAETADRLAKIRYALVGYRDDLLRLLAEVHEGLDSGAVPISPQLRGLIATYQPGSGDFLLSILGQPNHSRRRQALRTFVSAWDLISPSQIETYLQGHMTLTAAHRPKLTAKIDAIISVEARLRDGWTGWPQLDDDKTVPFVTRTTRYLDDRPYDKPYQCPYPIANVGGYKVGELPEGKHTIKAVARYEFTHRGERRKGEIRSKESTFEVVSADMPDDLIAPRSTERADRVKRELLFHELNQPRRPREGLIVLNGNEIMHEPDESWQKKNGRIGLYCLVWEVAEPLDVDLCFDVEVRDNKTGTRYVTDPIVALKGKRSRGVLVPKNLQQFVRERDGYRGVTVDLKPSRTLALIHPEVTQYFPDPITRGELLMKVITPDPPKPPSK